jgi:hypothetical protein
MLEHHNRILKKGFNAMIRKQEEWCKTKERLEQVEKENERLRYDMMILRKQT